MWVKKCVEMREILFKNWKWLFKNTNQTPPNSLKNKNYSFSFKIRLIKKKRKKKGTFR